MKLYNYTKYMKLLGPVLYSSQENNSCDGYVSSLIACLSQVGDTANI